MIFIVISLASLTHMRGSHERNLFSRRSEERHIIIDGNVNRRFDLVVVISLSSFVTYEEREYRLMNAYKIVDEKV